jgi:hypothetical protein
MNPIAVAFSGKGAFNVFHRSASIFGRYGLTSERLSRELRIFADLARRFGARPTFPITAAVLARQPRLIYELQAAGVEFAIHGQYHVDHSALTLEAQRRQLTAAVCAFEKAGIAVRGFRAPYLRCNADTLMVLRELGLSYDASQALAWDVLPGSEPAAYQRALGFYRAVPTAVQSSLPRLQDGLVRIPYSLPDDEALIERLTPADSPTTLWLAILRRVLAVGELFTLGLHPERTSLLVRPLRAVLEAATAASPPVWLARLDEIADWWRERAKAQIWLEALSERRFRVTVSGPKSVTVLLRNAEAAAPAVRWADSYVRVLATSFEVEAPTPPVIGIAPDVPTGIGDFLREQGYLVVASVAGEGCAYWLETQSHFGPDMLRTLVEKIEASSCPLVKLGRWPDGARSALALTGDIDALTLWDYGLRFLER